MANKPYPFSVCKECAGSGGGDGGGVSQEYVDNALLPKIEVLQRGKSYKKGTVLLGTLESADHSYSIIVQVDADDYTPSGNLLMDCYIDNYVHCLVTIDAHNAVLAESAGKAQCDRKGNIIDETYAKRDIVNKPTDVASEITFARGTTTIYGEFVLTGETIPVRVIDTGEADFESSCIFKIGNTVLPISHEGVSMTWAGEDCSDEGYFYPQPNTTYELHAKRLGDMFSIRVGTIVNPHTEEE